MKHSGWLSTDAMYIPMYMYTGTGMCEMQSKMLIIVERPSQEPIPSSSRAIQGPLRLYRFLSVKNKHGPVRVVSAIPDVLAHIDEEKLNRLGRPAQHAGEKGHGHGL